MPKTRLQTIRHAAQLGRGDDARRGRVPQSSLGSEQRQGEQTQSTVPQAEDPGGASHATLGRQRQYERAQHEAGDDAQRKPGPVERLAKIEEGLARHEPKPQRTPPGRPGEHGSNCGAVAKDVTRHCRSGRGQPCQARHHEPDSAQ
jgi:hypothetical protein